MTTTSSPAIRVVLSGAWVLVVAAGAWLGRPARRVPLPRRNLVAPRGVGAVERLGQLVTRQRSDVSAVFNRCIGGGLLAAGFALVTLGTAAALFVGAAGAALPLLADRKQSQRQQKALAAALPETIDLLRVGVDAGLNIALALDGVAAFGDGALVTHVRQLRAEQIAGLTLEQALDRFVERTGPGMEPLARALHGASRYGTSTSSALAQLAADARATQRRDAEEAARKVPIKMLFPLICCTLPAFGLLTIAPLLVTSLRSVIH